MAGEGSGAGGSDFTAAGIGGVSGVEAGVSIVGRSSSAEAMMPMIWPTGYGDAFRDYDTTQETGGEGLDFYCCLVGFHLDDGFAPVDVIAFRLEPADDGALLHIEAHLGHYYVGGQWTASCEIFALPNT